MTAFRYAERVARLMRDARARIRPHRTVPPENAIAAIAEAIERAALRQRRRRLATAMGLAAAILGSIAFVVAAPWRSTRTITVATTLAPASVPRAKLLAGSEVRATLASADGQLQPLAPGHAWVSDERLQTDALPVTLSAGDGTTVEIDPRSDLKLLRADTQQWLRLGRGAVALHVAKLQAGQRFVVLTPDAEVEVRGTRFHVGSLPRTRIAGMERPRESSWMKAWSWFARPRARFVFRPGQRWPHDCRRSHGAGAAVSCRRDETSTRSLRRPRLPRRWRRRTILLALPSEQSAPEITRRPRTCWTPC